jgi:CheY-like chemotaxis protein
LRRKTLLSKNVFAMKAPKSTNMLVVEDNADDSFMLIRQLEKAQIDDHVTVIDNGREALDFLLKATHPPLALFLDLRLPGLSGVELLEKIRREARLQAMPVIIMTGSSDPEDLSECSRLGVTAYLSKPVALSTFIQTVTHLFPKTTAE